MGVKMSASLCFMFSTTMVVAVIWPKIYVMCKNSGKSSFESHESEDPFMDDFDSPTTGDDANPRGDGGPHKHAENDDDEEPSTLSRAGAQLLPRSSMLSKTVLTAQVSNSTSVSTAAQGSDQLPAPGEGCEF